MTPTAVLGPLLLTMAVSFLIGIGLREYYEAEQKFDTFGTVRTFVFIGLVGFMLFQLPEVGHAAFITGLAGLIVFLAIYYVHKLEHKNGPGIIGMLIALVTYAAGPVALREPAWLLVLVAISVLLTLHSKGRIRRFTDSLETGEVVTVCKFLAIAAVILPLIPADASGVHGRIGALLAMLPVTPRQIWYAVVVTTSISYLGYVFQQYFFPTRGLQVTGLIGGVYSSTASVLVIARKSREAPSVSGDASVAVLFAIGMMYVRLLTLVAVFRPDLSIKAAPAMLGLAALSFGHAFAWRRRMPAAPAPDAPPHAVHRNPLELTTALLFAAAFVVIAVVTKYTLAAFHDPGLRMLSFVVGFSDITPFVISILQGNLGISGTQVLEALIIASASNNVMKLVYIWLAGSRALGRRVTPALMSFAGMSLVLAVLTRFVFR